VRDVGQVHHHAQPVHLLHYELRNTHTHASLWPWSKGEWEARGIIMENRSQREVWSGIQRVFWQREWLFPATGTQRRHLDTMLNKFHPPPSLINYLPKIRVHIFFKLISSPQSLESPLYERFPHNILCVFLLSPI
jgi:hypothetical protein